MISGTCTHKCLCYFVEGRILFLMATINFEPVLFPGCQSIKRISKNKAKYKAAAGLLPKDISCFIEAAFEVTSNV